MAPERVPLVSPSQQFQLPMPANSHRALEPVAKQTQTPFRLQLQQGSAGPASEPWLWQSQKLESGLPEDFVALARPQPMQARKKPEPPTLSKETQETQEQENRKWLADVVSGARAPAASTLTLQPPPAFQDP